MIGTGYDHAEYIDDELKTMNSGAETWDRKGTKQTSKMM